MFTCLPPRCPSRPGGGGSRKSLSLQKIHHLVVIRRVRMVRLKKQYDLYRTLMRLSGFSRISFSRARKKRRDDDISRHYYSCKVLRSCPRHLTSTGVGAGVRSRSSSRVRVRPALAVRTLATRASPPTAHGTPWTGLATCSLI